ncbi:Copia protein [Senna tora]|uniref:Copia protein n=1 Tax=Senna tora TaxID=362788 RepID=A0A834TIS1_9FABA|nr:Copia protein [Senna tora]
MKLKMRESETRSQEEIESSFNPINLNYTFQKEDPLSPWIEERENPLLDGVQNAEWLPRIDTDEEDEEGDNDDDSDSNEGDNGDGGLSPLSNNSGGNNDSGGDNNNDGGNRDIDEDTYQEVPYCMCNPNFFIDMTHAISDARRGSSQSGRGHFQQLNMIDDSSSSSYSHSDSTYGTGESSQSSQGYPPLYNQPLPYQPQFPTNYQCLYHHPSSNFPYPQQMEQRGG